MDYVAFRKSEKRKDSRGATVTSEYMLTVYTAKQVKVASEYVELVGMKHGTNRFNRDTTVGYLSYDDISKSLGVSKSTLKDLLEIDRLSLQEIASLWGNP